MKAGRFSVNGQEKKSKSERFVKAKQVLLPVLDQINQRFSVVEKRLKDLQPVNAAWAQYKSEPTDPYHPDFCYHITYCVGVAKHNGEWRICHGVFDDGQPEDPGHVEPISETSRWVRVEVASSLPEWLPKLEERIIQGTEEFVPRAEKALAAMMLGLQEI
jgi:hypothetical protein